MHNIPKGLSLERERLEDTSAEFVRLERRTPHHFVLPFFNVNIGHAIKNQDSPVVSHDWSSKKRNDHDTLCRPKLIGNLFSASKK